MKPRFKLRDEPQLLWDKNLHVKIKGARGRGSRWAACTEGNCRSKVWPRVQYVGMRTSPSLLPGRPSAEAAIGGDGIASGR